MGKSKVWYWLLLVGIVMVVASYVLPIGTVEAYTKIRWCHAEPPFASQGPARSYQMMEGFAHDVEGHRLHTNDIGPLGPGEMCPFPPPTKTLIPSTFTVVPTATGTTVPPTLPATATPVTPTLIVTPSVTPFPPTPTETETVVPSATSSATAVITETGTAVVTATETATATLTSTATATATGTATDTATETAITGTATTSVIRTSTAGPTFTPIAIILPPEGGGERDAEIMPKTGGENVVVPWLELLRMAGVLVCGLSMVVIGVTRR